MVNTTPTNHHKYHWETDGTCGILLGKRWDINWEKDGILVPRKMGFRAR